MTVRNGGQITPMADGRDEDLLEAVQALEGSDEVECSSCGPHVERARGDGAPKVAKLLDQGLPYQEIARRTGASTTTVTRVAHWLRHGEGGYRTARTAGRPSPTA